MALLLVLAMTLSPVAAPPVSPPAAVLDQPTPEWWEGPIRYILKIREEEKYRRLRTEAEREAFVRRFWEALDPTPGTPANERRQVFWDRVEWANRLFHDSTAPGWKTDRGKLYVLLGPPHELSRREGGEIWTYRGLPIPNTPPEIRLAFYRGRDGAYHLSSRPVTYTPPVMTRIGPLGDDALSLMADVGSVQVIKERILLPEATGRSETDYFFGGMVSERQFLFHLAGDGSTFVTLAATIPTGQFLESEKKTRTPDLSVSLTASDAASGEVVVRLQERMSRDPAWEPGSGRAEPFEIGFPLPPGTYRIEYTLIEVGSRRGAVFSESLTVPDLTSGLTLSDVTLAHASTRGPGDLPVDLRSDLPFPDAAKSFHRDERLHLAFQVYNAGRNGEDPDLDVEYDFYYRAGSEWWLVGKPVRLQGVTGESLRYSLPLTGWPDGDYRLNVRVRDNAAGSTAGREVEFKVQSGAGPVPPAAPHRGR